MGPLDRTDDPLAAVTLSGEFVQCGAHSSGRITSEWSRRDRRSDAIRAPWRGAHSDRNTDGERKELRIFFHMGRVTTLVALRGVWLRGRPRATRGGVADLSVSL